MRRVFFCDTLRWGGELITPFLSFANPGGRA
jgi:hypothetical protein